MLAVCLFFIPKLNLLALGGETAGIRIDDLLLVSTAAFLVLRWIYTSDLKISRFVLACFLVVIAFCLSNLLNLGHSSIFYSLRMLEYLVFFWVGLALTGDFQKLIKWLILINCGLIFLQAAHVVGGFTADGYLGLLGRPSGLSNHPAEMGAWLNLMFAALVFGGETKFWRWSLLVLVCIFLTASRISLFTHCILTVIYVYRSSHRKSAIVLRSAFVAGLLIAAVAIIPNPVRDRSGQVLSLDNISTFTKFYKTIPVETRFTEFSSALSPSNAPDTVDPSWWMRLVKWTQVTKLYLNASWLTWIFGIGPGAIGPALDGSWLRLLIECGLLGTFVFVVMLRRIAALSPACTMAVVALSINMLLIDSHIAYKVMAFLFLLAGNTYARRTGLTPVIPQALEDDLPFEATSVGHA